MKFETDDIKKAESIFDIPDILLRLEKKVDGLTSQISTMISGFTDTIKIIKEFVNIIKGDALNPENSNQTKIPEAMFR